jgi:hypothetical protein
MYIWEAKNKIPDSLNIVLQNHVGGIYWDTVYCRNVFRIYNVFDLITFGLRNYICDYERSIWYFYTECRDRSENICKGSAIQEDCDMKANTPLTRKLCPVACGACGDYGKRLQNC